MDKKNAFNSDWNQLLVILKKLVKADTVLLVDAKNRLVGASAKGLPLNYYKGIIEFDHNGIKINEVELENQLIDNENPCLVNPVYLNKEVWGALVVMFNKSQKSIELFKPELEVFTQNIENQLELIELRREKAEMEIFLSKQCMILSATKSILSISDESGNIVFHSHQDSSKLNSKCFKYFTGSNFKCEKCPLRKKVLEKTTFTYKTVDNKMIKVIAYPFEISPGVWQVAELRTDITDCSIDEYKIDLEGRMEHGLNASNIVYLEYDVNSNKFWFNSVLERIVEFDVNKQFDIAWLKSRVHQDDLIDLLRRLNFNEQNKESNKNVVVEFRFLNGHNVYIWLRFSGVLFFKEKKIIKVSGTLTDVSDSRILMQALLNERNNSMQASEAKSMFLANMSHEIRTPMNAIIGFSELLSKKINDPSLVGFLNSIKSSGRVLLDLINDLLDLEKIEAGKMIVRKENTYFESLLAEVEQSFYLRFAEKQLKFSVNRSKDFPSLIYVDSLKIKQILLNLISNALKFTQAGEVNVYCSFDYNNTGNIGSLKIHVHDTGIGIPLDKQNNIFKPFIQNKEEGDKEYQGTGLGLSIVQKLVAMMGGEISLQSQLDEGSTFTILLHNVEVKDDLLADVEVETESDIRFNRENILIVDGVETNRNVLCAMCQNLNLSCETYAGGEGIINKIFSCDPKVILMDIRNEKKKDFATVKMIKENDKLENIPMIAISSSSNIKEPELAKNNGFHGFISKPIPEKKLIQELSKFISPSYYNSSSPSLNLVTNNEVVLSEKDKKVLSGCFNTDFISLLNELRERISSKKLKRFVAELKNISEQVNVEDLEIYTDEMNNAITSFDYEVIQKMLMKFKLFENAIK